MPDAVRHRHAMLSLVDHEYGNGRNHGHFHPASAAEALPGRLGVGDADLSDLTAFGHVDQYAPNALTGRDPISASRTTCQARCRVKNRSELSSSNAGISGCFPVLAC